jgi:hypothetical protein
LLEAQVHPETVRPALSTNLASAPAGTELLSRNPFAVETEGGIISVLSVSPFSDDQGALE